jgi:hypothetical protein
VELVHDTLAQELAIRRVEVFSSAARGKAVGPK